MEYVFDDGGRSKYFKAEHVGDCVCRAIAIATGMDYKEVYDELQRRAKQETDIQLKKHRGNKRSSARNGMFRETWKEYLADLGWEYHSTCGVGKGISCHLVADELPMGTVLVKVTKHLVCVKDGIIHDTYNSSIKQYYDDCGNLVTNDRRAVYGYWTAPQQQS